MKKIDYYGNIRNDLIAYMSNNITKVIELGCGKGNTIKKIKELYPKSYVIGIEKDKKSAMIAKNYADLIFEGDIEIMDLNIKENSIDLILCGDVIEHLKDPWIVLKKFTNVLNAKGLLIATIPNVGHLSSIIKILFNKYSFQDSGIFDRTHLRFYTEKTIRILFEESGYCIENIIPVYSSSIKTKLLIFFSLGLLRRFLIASYRIVAKRC
jgi:SAM-dependent methyltransferase